MAIKNISSAWKTHLKTGFPPTDRFFVDFRQQEYPPLSTGADPTAHNLIYDKIKSTDNMPGSHNAIIGGALIGLWRMDEGAGTDIADGSGNGNNGTFEGTTPAWGTGISDDCCDFAGVDERVDCGNGAPLDDIGNGSFSISFWMKSKDAVPLNYGMLFSKNQDANNRIEIYSFGTTNRLYFVFVKAGVGEWGPFSVDSTPFDTNFNHIVLIINRTTDKAIVYVNTVKDSTELDISDLPADASNTGNLAWGARAGGANPYEGLIDECRIYNRVLTEAEIEVLYSNPPGPANTVPASPSYALAMPDSGKFTIRLMVEPWFMYSVAADFVFFAWYIDATHYFKIYYDNDAPDKIAAEWYDGTAARQLLSGQFDDGTSHTDINQLLIIDTAIDLTTGDTTGSQLWINRVSKDTAWDDNIDAKSSEFALNSMGHIAGANQADSLFNQVILIPDHVATDADVQNDYKSVKKEMIVWNFNGEGMGRTRTNITRHVLKKRYSKTPTFKANRLSLDLKSVSGEFADDQYAAFDPDNDVFNGLATQKYMQHSCPVIAETWYGNDHEPYFIGRVDIKLFARRSGAGLASMVSITAEDAIAEIALKQKRKARSWEDKKLSDSTEADSLIHLIARLATQKEIYNFLSNSSFENTTIANSWVVGGAGATFSKVAGGLFGSNQGDLVYGAAACTVIQTVTFTGTKKLNVGETWTFYLWLKSASACGDNITLEERDSVGLNDSTDTAFALSGGEGWKLFSVSHTITDSDSDRLRVEINLNDAGVTLSLDGAMLVQNDRAYNWFILNDNDGASGVEAADDADYAAYDTVGFDVDFVNIVHPWAVIDQDESVWKPLKELAIASIQTYIGLDPCGTLKFRAMLKTGYADPSSLETIGDTDFRNIRTQLSKINKIEILGNHITKDTDISQAWDAHSVGLFGDGQLVYINLANGDTWPDPAIYGEYWAKYINFKKPTDLPGPAGYISFVEAMLGG